MTTFTERNWNGIRYSQFYLLSQSSEQYFLRDIFQVDREENTRYIFGLMSIYVNRTCLSGALISFLILSPLSPCRLASWLVAGVCHRVMSQRKQIIKNIIVARWSVAQINCCLKITSDLSVVSYKSVRRKDKGLVAMRKCYSRNFA